jgi:hypothetical protein
MTEQIDVAALRRLLEAPPGKGWYIPENGAPVKIEMPTVVLQRVSLTALLDVAEAAQKFVKQAHATYGYDVDEIPGWVVYQKLHDAVARLQVQP